MGDMNVSSGVCNIPAVFDTAVREANHEFFFPGGRNASRFCERVMFTNAIASGDAPRSAMTTAHARVDRVLLISVDGLQRGRS